MRVILLSDVPGTGHAGDLLEVKEGFARNYLLPKGLAEVPSGQAAQKILRAKSEKQKLEKKRQEKLEKSVESLDGRKVTLMVKTNAQGHPYRAVTKKDLASELGIEPKLIEDINLKSVGQYKIKINKGKQVAVVFLEIKPEK